MRAMLKTAAVAFAAASLLSACAKGGAGAGLSDDDMTLGKADAPVTVIEYASDTCSHCARFVGQPQDLSAPQLDRPQGKVTAVRGEDLEAALIAQVLAEPREQLRVMKHTVDCAQASGWARRSRCNLDNRNAR